MTSEAYCWQGSQVEACVCLHDFFSRPVAKSLFSKKQQFSFLYVLCWVFFFVCVLVLSPNEVSANTVCQLLELENVNSKTNSSVCEQAD